MKCIACQKEDLEPFLVRSDGIVFDRCKNCGLIISPKSGRTKYEEQYFEKNIDSNIGYQQYSKEPIFELFWQVALVKLFGGNKNDRILDVGCATGKFMELAEAQEFQVEGIDISKYGIDICQKKGLNVSQKDINQTLMSQKQYNFICAWDLVEHLNNISDFLEKVKISLLEDGVFLFSTPNATDKKTTWSCFNRSFEHLIYFSKYSLEKLIERNGGLYIEMFHIEHAGLDSLFGIVTKNPQFFKKNKRIINALKEKTLTGNSDQDFLLATIYANFNLKKSINVYINKYPQKRSLIQLSMAIKLPNIDKQIKDLNSLAQFWHYDSYGWQYLQYSQSLKAFILSEEVKLLKEKNSQLIRELEFVYNRRSWRYMKYLKRQIKKSISFTKILILKIFLKEILKYLMRIKEKLKVLFSKYMIRSEDLLGGNFDFIILKNETEKWQTNGFEKVGNDWHIRVKRKTDNRIFLLDQPLFYTLQILGEKEIPRELFMTYGVEEQYSKKIEKILRKLKLC